MDQLEVGERAGSQSEIQRAADEISVSSGKKVTTSSIEQYIPLAVFVQRDIAAGRASPNAQPGSSR